MAINAGSVRIMADIDTASLRRGILKMNADLGKIVGKTEGFKADLATISSLAGSAAFGLTALGVAGAGAMIGLASKAPAVAGTLAKMKVQVDKITRTMGSAFKPVFESGVEGLKKLANWVSVNQDKLAFFGKIIIGVSKGMATLVGWILKAAWGIGTFIGNVTFDAIEGLVTWITSATTAFYNFFSAKILFQHRKLLNFQYLKT